MRVLRSALSAAFFLMFGVGGILFSLLLLLPVPKAAARRTLKSLFRFFVWTGRVTGLFRVDIPPEDARRLASLSGCVVVSNHRTLIDAVILISLLGDSVCVTKEAVSRNPFMLVTARKILVVNDGPVSVVKSAERYLKEGVNVVVFPEGTRTPADVVDHVFHKGAAHIAIRAAAPVELVSMDCDMAVLAKGQPWWDVGDRTAVYRMRCRGREEPDGFVSEGVPRKEAAARLTDRMKEGIFAG